MSTPQRRGSNYDNQLAKQLHQVTDDPITAHSMRGSGNTATPQPDVLVRTPDVDHSIEAKRSSIDGGERTTFLSMEDIVQLHACQNKITRTWAAQKFTHRELLVVELRYSEDTDEALDSLVDAIPSVFDANRTASDNITVRKPTTEQWPSARSGVADVTVLCDALGLPMGETDD